MAGLAGRSYRSSRMTCWLNFCRICREIAMLVITRKPGEGIKIGDVTIYVNRICGTTVKIAIDAPKEVKVLRGELQERK